MAAASAGAAIPLLASASEPASSSVYESPSLSADLKQLEKEKRRLVCLAQGAFLSLSRTIC